MIKFQKAWKFYFWFSLAGLLAGFVFDLTTEATSPSLADTMLNVASYVVELVALVCLYGFAWQKRYVNRIFWIVFFVVSTGFFGYTIGYEMLFGIEELPVSGPFVFFMIVFTLLVLAPGFLANYLYAFRSKHIW